MKDYKSLKIWQKSNETATAIHELSARFPKDEIYNLTSQIRRASLSVPTNIVEGFYRTKKEFIHFLIIAMGSLKETEYLLETAFDRNYLCKKDYERIQGLIIETSKMISVFIKRVSIDQPANILTS